MPKRAYPFDSVSPLQLKTHVGEKELSQGVAGETLMREIFERTKKMLFKGAKAVMGHQEHQGANGKEKEFTLHELPTGQTTIGRDGKLHKSKQLSQIPPTGVSKACSFCVRSVIEKEVCSQCERSVCKDCCKPCSCCSAITCSFCTVSVDGNDGDQMFCSTCAVFEA
ncbi:hypothetical protein GDO86_016102 [Hymenochirus boettgeri]|uniref:Apoptosis regulatory protein Siva n=1 Tax=Hymenochirus boettgeri TaxID=247094 RepID=A0A8T2K101_9PIPI|nr:hypothetical protein GDO86_016102 [Hymenochirus boettgeri]